MKNTFWFYSNFTSTNMATPSNYENGNYKSICQYGYPDYPSGFVNVFSLISISFKF